MQDQPTTPAQPTPQPEQQSVKEITPNTLEKITKLAKKAGVILGAALLLTISLVLAWYISQRALGNRNQETPSNQTEEQTAAPPVPESTASETKDGYKTYENEKEGFRFDFLEEAYYEQLTPFSDEPTHYRVVLAGPGQTEKIVNEQDLVDGYIFRVSVYENLDTPLTQLSNRKKERYKELCQETAKYSDNSDLMIQGLPANFFAIEDCPQDIEHYFVTNKSKLYELALTYKGDLGISQVYETKARDILKSFRFTNIYRPESTHQVVTSKEYGFSFVHPKLTQDCCEIIGPAQSTVSRFITLGTESEGFAIFIEKNPELKAFGTYVTEQKQKLIQEYQIIVGKNPEPSEEEITISGVQGVMLVGYAWWGDAIYLPIPGKEQFLIIVKPQTSEEFDKIFAEILKTLQFTN